MHPSTNTNLYGGAQPTPVQPGYGTDPSQQNATAAKGHAAAGKEHAKAGAQAGMDSMKDKGKQMLAKVGIGKDKHATHDHHDHHVGHAGHGTGASVLPGTGMHDTPGYAGHGTGATALPGTGMHDTPGYAGHGTGATAHPGTGMHDTSGYAGHGTGANALHTPGTGTGTYNTHGVAGQGHGTGGKDSMMDKGKHMLSQAGLAKDPHTTHDQHDHHHAGHANHGPGTNVLTPGTGTGTYNSPGVAGQGHGTGGKESMMDKGKSMLAKVGLAKDPHAPDTVGTAGHGPGAGGVHGHGHKHGGVL